MKYRTGYRGKLVAALLIAAVTISGAASYGADAASTSAGLPSEATTFPGGPGYEGDGAPAAPTLDMTNYGIHLPVSTFVTALTMETIGMKLLGEKDAATGPLAAAAKQVSPYEKPYVAPQKQQKPGKQQKPEGTQKPETSQKPAAVPSQSKAKPGSRVVDPKKPMIALTFDDGPSQYTPKVLDALKKSGGRATFFMVGYKAGTYSSTIKRMTAEGNEVGNHTYDHKDLSKLSTEEIQKQVDSASAAIKKAGGVAPKLVRLPYGAFNDTVKKTVKQPMINWSVDTQDWKTKSRDKTVDWVMSHAKDGEIILMHDSHQWSAEAAEIIIPKLVEQGYQLVTVSELFEAKGKTLSPGKIYRRP